MMKTIKPVTWEEFKKNTSPKYSQSAVTQIKNIPRDCAEQMTKMLGGSSADVDKFYKDFEDLK